MAQPVNGPDFSRAFLAAALDHIGEIEDAQDNVKNFSHFW
jgi:hypothetical protein